VSGWPEVDPQTQVLSPAVNAGTAEGLPTRRRDALQRPLTSGHTSNDADKGEVLACVSQRAGGEW